MQELYVSGAKSGFECLYKNVATSHGVGNYSLMFSPCSVTSEFLNYKEHYKITFTLYNTVTSNPLM